MFFYLSLSLSLSLEADTDAAVTEIQRRRRSVSVIQQLKKYRLKKYDAVTSNLLSFHNKCHGDMFFSFLKRERERDGEKQRCSLRRETWRYIWCGSVKTEEHSPFDAILMKEERKRDRERERKRKRKRDREREKERKRKKKKEREIGMVNSFA
jgi:hypothetical protein